MKGWCFEITKEHPKFESNYSKLLNLLVSYPWQINVLATLNIKMEIILHNYTLNVLAQTSKGTSYALRPQSFYLQTHFFFGQTEINLQTHFTPCFKCEFLCTI